MKVAIVHDYIKEYGGAERVLETLLEIYPDAAVFASIYAPEFLGPHRERFEKFKIKTTFLNEIPFRHKLISPLRLIAPMAFRSMDLSGFDVVIVSQTGAYFPNLVSVKNGKEAQVLICYTHTPPRYLYGYATARDWKKNKIFAFFAEIANHFLRMTDFNSSKNVDFFIANSEEVKSRIKKFYRRDSVVIYPPVGVVGGRVSGLGKSKTKNYDLQPKTYYLTGGRLARAKGIDVIVKAFNKNGLPLKIFGKGFAGYEEELKQEVRSKNQESIIEFLGEVTDDKKFELMRNAKAFVFASYDEDFGITPVESMSVGTPVIAFRSGGVKETIVEGKTGLFFDENSPEELNKAVDKLKKINIDPKDCIKQAEKFSKERFERDIKDFVNDKIK